LKKYRGMGQIHFVVGSGWEPATSHKFFIGIGLVRSNGDPASVPSDPTLNPLIPHWFGAVPAQICEFLSHRSIKHGVQDKDLTGELFNPD
jgi:hypothetical protein